MLLPATPHSSVPSAAPSPHTSSPSTPPAISPRAPPTPQTPPSQSLPTPSPSSQIPCTPLTTETTDARPPGPLKPFPSPQPLINHNPPKLHHLHCPTRHPPCPTASPKSPRIPVPQPPDRSAQQAPPQAHSDSLRPFQGPGAHSLPQPSPSGPSLPQPLGGPSAAQYRRGCARGKMAAGPLHLSALDCPPWAHAQQPAGRVPQRRLAGGCCSQCRPVFPCPLLPSAAMSHPYTSAPTAHPHTSLPHLELL